MRERLTVAQPMQRATVTPDDFETIACAGFRNEITIGCPILTQVLGSNYAQVLFPSAPNGRYNGILLFANHIEIIIRRGPGINMIGDLETLASLRINARQLDKSTIFRGVDFTLLGIGQAAFHASQIFG